ncbi:biotin/lipoyl-containing protein [Ammoniphilus sp. YIM 78166]|uniref:biotin/lipoyl-containing protein n=1 Tax=Ammoniphilus sp. YIM 78166 TaxID=1644106 RepID=UPI00106F80B1|nr:biotin/lipoyl-containing protein [Ammoniphilus sp. YIM 78166]
MKLHEIRELIKLVDQSSIEELEIENDGVQITFKKATPVIEESVESEVPVFEVETTFGEAATALEAQVQEIEHPETAAPIENLVSIVSPWVGVFSNPTISVGERVEEGQLLCHCSVETLKLFHEIKSSVSGEVVEVLTAEGELIEYGQPLFVIKAD